MDRTTSKTAVRTTVITTSAIAAAIALALTGCGGSVPESSNYTPIKTESPAESPIESAAPKPGVLSIPFSANDLRNVHFACAGPDMVYLTGSNSNIFVVPNHPDCAS